MLWVVNDIDIYLLHCVFEWHRWSGRDLTHTRQDIAINISWLSVKFCQGVAIRLPELTSKVGNYVNVAGASRSGEIHRKVESLPG